MRFFIDNADLNAGISTVIKAMPTRTTISILEGIFIEAQKDSIKIKCSDLSLLIETYIPATVEEEGAAVLPGRLFSEMARKLPGESTLIYDSNDTVYIESGRTKTTLQASDAKQFPDMPSINGDKALVIKQNTLKEMIKQTIFATAQDDTKPILTGVLMEIADNVLTLVALDGYRLALRREALDSQTGDFSVVVPAKSLAEINRTLLDTDEETRLFFSKTHMLLDMGHTKLITRLLDGEFIRYKQILPDKHSTRVRLNRQELLEALERASLMAREGKSNLVKFSFSGETLTMSANSELGHINEEIRTEIIGNELDIAFNVRFFSDVLKNLDDEYLYLDMTSNISPCVVIPVQGDSFYYLILPVRLFSN